MLDTENTRRTCDVGIYGMGVMGSSYMENLHDRGYRVAIYNRRFEKTEAVAAGKKNILACSSVEKFVLALKEPKIIMLFVQAGNPVDTILEQLKTVVDKNTIIVDSGNSRLSDTLRRAQKYKDDFIFCDMGVSGGKYGARNGPSIMIGCSTDAWRHLQDILMATAASHGSEKCCKQVGPVGSGHLVKMVHNGIEYAVMQALAELYVIMKTEKMQMEDIKKLYESLAADEVTDSYLSNITAKIVGIEMPEEWKPLSQKKYLVDAISCSTSQKGTGKWAVQYGLDAMSPISLIYASVDARVMSCCKKRCENMLLAADAESTECKRPLAEDDMSRTRLLKAYYLVCILTAFDQGLNLIHSISCSYGKDIRLADVLDVWMNGCILHGRILNLLKQHMQDGEWDVIGKQFFKTLVDENMGDMKKVLMFALESDLPVPVGASVLNYLNFIRGKPSGGNMIQAQRDFFGVHGFKIGKEPDLHYGWNYTG